MKRQGKKESQKRGVVKWHWRRSKPSANKIMTCKLGKCLKFFCGQNPFGISSEDAFILLPTNFFLLIAHDNLNLSEKFMKKILVQDTSKLQLGVTKQQFKVVCRAVMYNRKRPFNMQKNVLNREARVFDTTNAVLNKQKTNRHLAASYLLKTQEVVFQDKTKRKRKTLLCCLVLRFSFSLRRAVFL